MIDNKEKIKFTVSDEMSELFRLFNVIKITDRIDRLSSVERKLLLLLATENFSEKNQFVRSNIIPYEVDLRLIFDLQKEEKTDDSDLIYLCEKTGDKCIDTGVLFLNDGSRMPKPLTDEEAVLLRREYNIDDLIG